MQKNKSCEVMVTIIQKAKFFYLENKNCPISWKPSDIDFLYPCLKEAALMKCILPKG